MTVGSGIFLIVVGAIIRYGISLELAGVHENTIGAILILAGIVVAVLGLISAPFRWAAWRRRDYVPPEERPPY